MSIELGFKRILPFYPYRPSQIHSSPSFSKRFPPSGWKVSSRNIPEAFRVLFTSLFAWLTLIAASALAAPSPQLQGLDTGIWSTIGDNDLNPDQAVTSSSDREFIIRFTPTTAGSATPTITLETDLSSLNAEYTFAVTGVG